MTRPLPHAPALDAFIREISDIYGLSALECDELQDEISAAVNASAINALAIRPRVTPDAPALAPQGVQDGPEFMRPEEVSRALGIHLSTLQGMRRRMEGPAFRKNVKAVFYRRADVRAWVEDQSKTTTPANGHADPSELAL